MALIDQFTMASNATFKSRVEQSVLTRVRSQIATADSGNRALYQKILADPSTVAANIAKAIAPDTTLAARAVADATGTTATDAEINSAVNVALPFFVV